MISTSEAPSDPSPSKPHLPFPAVKPWGAHKLLRCVKPPPADTGLDGVRDKLMAHLRHAADKIQLAVPQPPDEAPAPWSLRTRRGTCGKGDGGVAGEEPGRRLRARTAVEERRKFSVSLSRDEIEDDMYALTGKKASRRPKKRPRAVKNQLDMLYPGFYLAEAAPELYEVVEPES